MYVDDELPPARSWYADRPGEVAFDPEGETYGFAGPDAGYVGKLVPLFRDRLVPGTTHREDVIAAGKAIAMRRAAICGRAPMAEDLEVAFLVLGALEDVPGDWSGVGQQIAERISGLRYPVAAARAAALAGAVGRTWLVTKPDAVRARLKAEGPRGTFSDDVVPADA